MPLAWGLAVMKYPPLAATPDVAVLLPYTAELEVLAEIAEMVLLPLPLSRTSRVAAGAVVPMPTLTLAQLFAVVQPLMPVMPPRTKALLSVTEAKAPMAVLL